MVLFVHHAPWMAGEMGAPPKPQSRQTPFWSHPSTSPTASPDGGSQLLVAQEGARDPVRLIVRRKACRIPLIPLCILPQIFLFCDLSLGLLGRGSARDAPPRLGAWGTVAQGGLASALTKETQTVNSVY